MIKIAAQNHRLLSRYNVHSISHPPPLSPHFNTEQHSNDHIHSLCKSRHYQQALQAYNILKTNTHFSLSHNNYIPLIIACSSLKNLNLGRKLHNDLVNTNTFLKDVVMQNYIINMYGKCGSLEDARKVFDEMLERNVVTWTSMIAGYSQNRREMDGMVMYREMRCEGVMPDQFAFGSVVRACVGMRDLELGKQLHGQVMKSEFGSQVIPQNALVGMYTKFGEIDDAWRVFERIACKDLISWGSIIGGFAQQGCELKALCLFKEMLSLGLYYPNEFLFGSVFSACGGLLRDDYGLEIHGLSVKFGLGKDAYAGCSLSDMYAKCGKLDSAKKVFCQIESPDLVSWNAIIAAFAYSGDSDESLSLFSQMRRVGFVPNEITVLSLLCSFTNSCTLYQGKQVHSYAIIMGLDFDIPVCNSLLTMYAHCSDLSDAFKIFNEIANYLDLVSWNAILTACLHHNQANEVCRLLKLMHTSQYKLDQTTLLNVIGASALLASLEMGNQVHDYVIKSGYEAEMSVSNGLIDMYTKCGALSDARKLLESMTTPDVVSWSSLIVGYAQVGYGKEALDLFATMKNLGIQPNHVTFIGVLSACSHVGLVEEGCHYYRTMETEHGVVPTREHENCVVDMLARAGHLREAEKFISQMSFNPDIVVWKTLLAACRTHRDVEIGKRTAESVLKLDPSDSGAHVLLCNIYASSGCWDDVARVRKSMRSRGVRKAPGQSWIEFRDGIHVFSVEDRSHPKMDEIYSLLEELWIKITEPSTDYILDPEAAFFESRQD
ncbi:hypothetical protein ACHQM5_011970 [Ranunculus cassubicifolius]